jgi:hypothetical protein
MGCCCIGDRTGGGVACCMGVGRGTSGEKEGPDVAAKDAATGGTVSDGVGDGESS